MGLAALAILVRLAFADGTVVECETGEIVVYAPDARMVWVVNCDDRLFSDGFEEASGD